MPENKSILGKRLYTYKRKDILYILRDKLITSKYLLCIFLVSCFIESDTALLSPKLKVETKS